MYKSKKKPKLPRDQNDYLTGREHRILSLLVEGKTYAQIADGLGIGLDCLYVHCHRVRLKTGITDTGDASAIRAWLETYRPRVCEPTKLQLDILERYYLHKMNHHTIAHELGITPSTSANQMSLGIKRWGITARGEHRRAQLCALLEAHGERGKPYDPMSDPVFN